MTTKNQPVDVGTSGASRKIALAAGSLSTLAMLPGSALAALVTVTGPTINVGLTGTSFATWDIDGDNSGEFTLSRANDVGPGFASATWILERAGTGDRVVVGPLLRSFQSNNVGPLTGDIGNGVQLLRIKSSFISSSSTSSTVKTVSPLNSYVMGDNFFGFKFGSQYGWAKMNLDEFSGVSITEWTYGNQADEYVHFQTRAQAVPEPSALALLALGIGGLAALRSRKIKQPQSSF